MSRRPSGTTVPRFRRARLVAAPAIGLLAPFLLAVTPTADASEARPTTPWGPAYLLYDEQVSANIDVATTGKAMNVVAWRARRSDGTFQATAAVQLPGGPWGAPIPVNAATENAVSVQAVAWGAGNVSVLWERRAAQDSWTFKMRTVDANGDWGQITKLRTATYAFDGYQVDINDAGAVALGWENGDHQARVAVRRAKGSWDLPEAIPVVSPGSSFQYIANPRDLFISNAGKVSVIPWGHLSGTSGNALWLEDLKSDGSWASTRIGPTGGDRLTYNWVPESQFAANPAGDVAAVWPQQDPQTRQWTTLFAYRQSGGALGKAQTLGHDRCDYFDLSCADTALSNSGHAIVAWSQPGQDVDVEVARSSVSGQLGTRQKVFTVDWENAYSGVSVQANAAGDATVSFTGGNRNVISQEFVRCPAGQACASAVPRQNQPSWLDVLHYAITPSGATTIAWVSGCSGGEACRPNRVWARRLTGLG